MRHDPRWTTFYSAYLNHSVEFDIQNTVLGQPTQDKMLTHVSLMRDPRATKNMVPDEVWANLPPDSEVVRLEERRAQLKAGRYRVKGHEDEEEIRNIGERIRNRRAKRDKAIQEQYREYYFYNRPTWDIEKQARGEAEEQYVAPGIDLHIPERAQLAETLCKQPQGLGMEEISQLRIRAADLMTGLCGKQETAKRLRIWQRPHVVIKESPELDPFPLHMNKTQCPDCIGDERLSMQERTFVYCRPAVRNDHWDREHLEGKQCAAQRGAKRPRCS
jgi:uncharacterized protein DUF3435